MGVTPLVSGLVNSGPSTFSHGLCVKNTFIHVLEQKGSAKDRCNSCPAQIVCGFERSFSKECPFDKEVQSVMIKNVPCRCSQNEVLSCIHNHGFEGKYDMFHMPKRSARSNFGYAFLHFPHAADASRFHEKMSGVGIPGRISDKRLTIVPANIQSLVGTKQELKKTLTRVKLAQ